MFIPRMTNGVLSNAGNLNDAAHLKKWKCLRCYRAPGTPSGIISRCLRPGVHVLTYILQMIYLFLFLTAGWALSVFLLQFRVLSLLSSYMYLLSHPLASNPYLKLFSSSIILQTSLADRSSQEISLARMQNELKSLRSEHAQR